MALRPRLLPGVPFVEVSRYGRERYTGRQAARSFWYCPRTVSDYVLSSSIGSTFLAA